jgi:Fic family protein
MISTKTAMLRKPLTPPNFEGLVKSNQDVLLNILSAAGAVPPGMEYLHWDKFRHLKPPESLTVEQAWLALKFHRSASLKPVGLRDTKGEPFRFLVTDQVQAELHRIDMRAGGSLGLPDPITNPQTRDRYVIRSLVEESITSSQLEGAVTTREVAKEMIRTGRPARDTSEQMIMNNYMTMRRISDLRKQDLTPELVLEIHRLVTDKTLDRADAAGRFRRDDEKRVIADDTGEVYHDPPAAAELPERLKLMCDFANGKSEHFFVHPVIRAIILHFWLAYDHPFYDGNGRTARALFYWAMLHQEYWLFEFISISHILTKAPKKYYRSFLYTETDENDLTYFIVHQIKVICSAIDELHAYIERKTREVQELNSHVRALDLFNHRQVALIRHALKHPYHVYVIESHRQSHNIVYQTARSDLMDLAAKGVLGIRRRGKKYTFAVPNDLSDRLLKLESESRQMHQISKPKGV